MFKLLAVLALTGFCQASLYDVDKINQNFDEKINDRISQQIQNELRASYLYQAYSHYFGRADVALPGFAKWFEKASIEERQHATGLIEYINKRGGSVELTSLDFSSMCTTVGDELEKVKEFSRSRACICSFMSHKKDSSCGDRNTWRNGLWAMQDTLALERYVNAKLLELHKEASDVNDPHLSHVLEHEYLDEQVEAIKSVGDMVRKLERVGEGIGEYMFDKEL